MEHSVNRPVGNRFRLVNFYNCIFNNVLLQLSKTRKKIRISKRRLFCSRWFTNFSESDDIVLKRKLCCNHNYPQSVSCLSRNEKVSFPFPETLYFFPKHVLSLKRSLFESLEVILKTSPCFSKPIDNLLFDWHMTDLQIPGVAKNV